MEDFFILLFCNENWMSFPFIFSMAIMWNVNMIFQLFTLHM